MISPPERAESEELESSLLEEEEDGGEGDRWRFRRDERLDRDREDDLVREVVPRGEEDEPEEVRVRVAFVGVDVSEDMEEEEEEEEEPSVADSEEVRTEEGNNSEDERGARSGETVVEVTGVRGAW